MQQYKISAGFTDIKIQFIKKTGSKKDPRDLDLWFSFQNNILSAHDTEFHNVFIFLALYDPVNKKWHLPLIKGSFGSRLVSHYVEIFNFKELQKMFNDLYLESSQIPVLRK